MKTFTYKQAKEIIEKNFIASRILKVWDNVKELDILFVDATGKEWELLSTADNYFQTVNDFVIMEA